MEDRNLLHQVDYDAGTVKYLGKTWPLTDTHLPTIDPRDPYALSPEEEECMERLRESFVTSSRLWNHMKWLVNRGGMYLTRDRTAIFHACIPVDDQGEFLSLEIDGKQVAGRAMFDAFDTLVRRAYRRGAEGVSTEDADWFYYLWAGQRSPLFGKDRMSTFQTYFIADHLTHAETKNPYFRLINEPEFGRRVAAEFGVDREDGLVVNGHVPVKVEEGEKPLKGGGNAVTIDGAFSEAYGDRGYTLILGPDKITLAEHHHFESITEVIEKDADIVPEVQVLRQYPEPRLRRDTEEGTRLRQRIQALERLIHAYREGVLAEG
jgi:fructose-1,6-bisphosphatase-3